jgi:hypothetical protein
MTLNTLKLVTLSNDTRHYDTQPYGTQQYDSKQYDRKDYNTQPSIMALGLTNFGTIILSTCNSKNLIY